MNNYSTEIKNQLDKDEKYRDRLFCRAYMLTDDISINLDIFPFYSQWNVTCCGKYKLLTHPLLQSFHYSEKNTHIILVGHAYNPFENLIDENTIIKGLLNAYSADYYMFLDNLDELTGVFVIFIITGDRIIGVQDPGGQRMLYYGKVNENIVVTSTPQLVEDVFKLSRDKDIITLLSSKGYYRGSGFLPGNKSAYREIKRLGPNTLIKYIHDSFIIERFFPREQRYELTSEKEKEKESKKLQKLFQINIELILRKWDKVGLSLTGGVDSKTTFANAKPWYNNLFVFSYISKDSERIDAEAAKSICNHFGVNHHLYEIPDKNEDVEDYELLQKIIEHNTSYTCKLHQNEKRKYITLQKKNDFNVEVKSDISEIGRAYTNRKYFRVKMPRKLTPRHLTIGQARYFFEPWCMKYADNAYKDFMLQTGLQDDILGYSMHDLVYWEVRMGAWASTSFASQEYIHEITIPYNNRKLLEMFLSFPESDRVHDIPHKMLIDLGNKDIRGINASVRDSYFDNKRVIMETIYYYYATVGNRINGKK